MSLQALFAHLHNGNLQTFPDALEFYLSNPRHRVDDQDAEGLTLLMRAAAKGNMSIVNLLLQKGAKLEKQHKGLERSAFMLAAAQGKKEMLSFLRDKGAKIDGTDCDGNTALMRTLCDAHLPIMEWLIENGAVLDTKNKQEITPLMLAASRGQIAVVRFLLSKEVNIHEKDKNGNTALMHAMLNDRPDRANQLEIIQLLVERGGLALVDAQNVLKKTVLMSASELGYIEIVRFLLSKKANPNLENYLRLNALVHALKNRHIKAADALVHYDASVETALSSPSCIQKTIYELFWDALRMIPVPSATEDPHEQFNERDEFNEGDELSPISNRYIRPVISTEMLVEQNNKLLNHPAQTAKAIAENTKISQSMAELIGGYLYPEKALLNMFQLELPKAIIFSASLVPDENANNQTSLAVITSPKLAKMS